MIGLPNVGAFGGRMAGSLGERISKRIGFSAFSCTWKGTWVRKFASIMGRAEIFAAGAVRNTPNVANEIPITQRSVAAANRRTKSTDLGALLGMRPSYRIHAKTAADDFAASA